MQLMCRKLFLDPQNYLAQNVNSAEVEKLCSRQTCPNYFTFCDFFHIVSLSQYFLLPISLSKFNYLSIQTLFFLHEKFYSMQVAYLIRICTVSKTLSII